MREKVKLLRNFHSPLRADEGFFSTSHLQLPTPGSRMVCNSEERKNLFSQHRSHWPYLSLSGVAFVNGTSRHQRTRKVKESERKQMHMMPCVLSHGLRLAEFSEEFAWDLITEEPYRKSALVDPRIEGPRIGPSILCKDSRIPSLHVIIVLQ